MRRRSAARSDCIGAECDDRDAGSRWVLPWCCLASRSEGIEYRVLGQSLQDRSQIGGQRGIHDHALPRDRVVELETGGMEEGAW